MQFWAPEYKGMFRYLKHPEMGNKAGKRDGKGHVLCGEAGDAWIVGSREKED